MNMFMIMAYYSLSIIIIYMRALHMPKQYYCIEFEEKQKHKAAYIRRLSEYNNGHAERARSRTHTEQN